MDAYKPVAVVDDSGLGVDIEYPTSVENMPLQIHTGKNSDANLRYTGAATWLSYFDLDMWKFIVVGTTVDIVSV